MNLPGMQEEKPLFCGFFFCLDIGAHIKSEAV